MKCSHILIFCALPICISEAARILGLISHSGRSQYVVFHTYFKALAARGHHVDVYGHYPLNKPMANYTDFNIADTDVFQYVPIQQIKAMGSFQVAKYLNRKMLDSCHKLFNNQNILKLMNSNTTYDVMITFLLGPDCSIGFSHRFKIPLIYIATSVSLPWLGHRIGNSENPAYIPNLFLPFTDKMNFWERLVNTVLYWALNIGYYTEADMPTEEMLKQHFGKDCPSVHELQQSTSLILVNSHFSINTPRPAVPAFVEIGGLHISSDGILPEDLQKYLNEAKEGVIYFSLGTMLRGDSLTQTKLRAFIDAFSQLPQRVLWKIDNISGLPDNVKIGTWFPQLEVLKHPNVRAFITHGGLLGIQEAIYAGVPMVAIPLVHDQPLNVKNCESKGVAVHLDFDSITIDSVLEALNKVLHDPSYLTNAKRLSQLFRDRPRSALDTAVYWTEYVIRHRGAPHLRSAALELTWYQNLLLDVILAIIALVIAFGFIVFYSFKIILKLMTGNVSHTAVKKNS